jgi:hypothetical protein
MAMRAVRGPERLILPTLRNPGNKIRFAGMSP